MAATINELLMDAQISHAADLKRYSESVVYRMISVLNRSDAAIAADLLQRLSDVSPSTFSMDRLESMLYSVRSLNREAFALVDRELTAELQDFTKYEVAFQQSMMTSILPVQVSVASVAAESVHAAAVARPFQGGLLKGFLSDMEDKKARLIRQTIADGFVQGKTTSQIVSEIRGTRAKGYSDGVIEITRRDAQAVVRTALAHTASFARDSFYDANADLLKGYVWLSTLDLRTSSPCRARDHKQYNKDRKPVGHSFPWGAGPGRLHWNCRSTSTPVVKSWKELGIDLPEFSPTTRASMGGQVPQATDYGTWLKNQSASRQDEVLGKTRGQLLRSGDLSMADMYSAKGSPLTLAQLREKHQKEFDRAGI
jgi:SPP1 gp7 family putative phage head morphogenesis protein